jgi:hypothetical protein
MYVTFKLNPGCKCCSTDSTGGCICNGLDNDTLTLTLSNVSSTYYSTPLDINRSYVVTGRTSAGDLVSCGVGGSNYGIAKCAWYDTFAMSEQVGIFSHDFNMLLTAKASSTGWSAFFIPCPITGTSFSFSQWEKDLSPGYACTTTRDMDLVTENAAYYDFSGASLTLSPTM